jgi:hypothetical protein
MLRPYAAGVPEGKGLDSFAPAPGYRHLMLQHNLAAFLCGYLDCEGHFERGFPLTNDLSRSPVARYPSARTDL